jgi:hypothetical protein
MIIVGIAIEIGALMVIGDNSLPSILGRKLIKVTCFGTSFVLPLQLKRFLLVRSPRHASTESFRCTFVQ